MTDFRMTGGQDDRRAELLTATRSASSSALVSEVVMRMAAVIGDRVAAGELLALMHDQVRHWVRTSGDEELSFADVDEAMRAAERLAGGAPIQYAARRAAFRHLALFVDERVLIPRPETELLVDAVLEATKGVAGGTVVDVGTGSGAIALALASEGHFDNVIATDISHDALRVARMNAERLAPTLRAAVDFRQGSGLLPVPERGLRAIVSNPPYIAFEEAAALPALVRDWEPSVALFAGDQGMSITKALVHDAAAHLAPGGVLALEVDVRRAGLVAELAASHGRYEAVKVLLDLTGRERFVVARRTEN